MFDILYTINPNAVAEIIQEEINIGLADTKDTQKLIEISPEYWSEISQLVKIIDKMIRNHKPWFR